MTVITLLETGNAKTIFLCIQIIFVFASELTDAINENNFQTSQNIFDGNKSLMAPAFNFAIYSRNIDFVKWVQKKYGNQQSNRFSSIATAAYQCDEALIKFLLRYYDVNYAIANRNNPLQIASIFCKNRTVDILLEGNAKTDIVNSNDQTPLFLAVRNHNEHSVRVLPNHGVNVNKIDRYGFTPLDYAIKDKSDQIVKILKTFKVPTHHYFYEEKEISEAIDSKDIKRISSEDIFLVRKMHSGDTLLTYAIKHKINWLFDALIQFSADVNTLNDDGSTAIEHALKTCNSYAVDRLIIHNAILNIYPEKQPLFSIIPKTCEYELSKKISKYVYKDSNVYFDKTTNLFWLDILELPLLEFDTAVKYCESLELNNLQWRLPTSSELLSIINMNRPHGYRFKKGFKVYFDRSSYWVAPDTQTKLLQYISLADDVKLISGTPYIGACHARCVSAGE